MRTTTIDAVLVPGQRVHERFDEQPKCMRFIQFKLFEQFSQRLRFATAAPQVLQIVTHLVAEERLHRGEVNEIAYRTNASADFEQITDCRASPPLTNFLLVQP